MSRLKNRRGQGLVEYVLIIALMGVMAIAAINKLGTTTQGGYTKASSKLQTKFNNM